MSSTTATVLNWVFGAATLISLALTVYYGRVAARLERARTKLEWHDVQAAATDLTNALSQAKFVPEAIFAPSLRGATFANLLLDELEQDIPVYVGITSWKSTAGGTKSCEGFVAIETTKWYVHVPECLLVRKGCRVLAVDDYAISGDFLTTFKKFLVERGFGQEDVKTMAIVTTKVAIHNRKAPDFYWMEATDTFYFPWGRSK